MADFALWGAAIAEALGFTKEEFLQAYANKIREQSDEALEASTEGMALLRFMDALPDAVWQDEPSRLFSELKKTVTNDDAEFAFGEELPKKASVLMKKLNVLRPNLRTAGLDLSSKKVNGRRQVVVRKIPAKPVQAVFAVQATETNGKTEEGIGGNSDSAADTAQSPDSFTRDDQDDADGIF